MAAVRVGLGEVAGAVPRIGVAAPEGAGAILGVIDGEAEKLSAWIMRETLARTSASTRRSSASSLSPKDCAV
jgi:hypothetical protein